MARILPGSRNGRTALAVLVLVLIAFGTCGYVALAAPALTEGGVRTAVQHSAPAEFSGTTSE